MSGLGNSFKNPAPLQPANFPSTGSNNSHLVNRTDDDGMYVSVGGRVASPTRFTAVGGEAGGDTPSSRRNHHAYDEYNTPEGGRGNYYSSKGDAGSRDPRDPYFKKLDYSVSVNESRQRHPHIRMRDAVADSEDDGGATGGKGGGDNRYFYHATHKQSWLAGWTMDCAKHPPTCLDAFCCLWCTHGMQWKKLHARPQPGGRVEVFQDSDMVARQQHGRGGRGGGASSTASAADGSHVAGNKAWNRGRGEPGMESPASPDHSGVDLVANNNKNRSTADNRNDENDTESCTEKINHIDWMCCIGTFFADLITLPLLATPLGSAAAQYHIRQQLRIRYNLVDAPGSMGADEITDAKLEEMRKHQHQREEAERLESRRRFGARFPNAAQDSIDHDREMEEIRRKDKKKKKNRRGQDGRDQYRDERDSPPEGDDDDDDRDEEHERKNESGNKEKEKEEPEEPEGWKATCRRACDCSCPNMSDDAKELLFSWCCSPCSAAQVHREFILRGEWPGGYWSKPMAVRADIGPGAGVYDVIKAMEAISPRRQHRTDRAEAMESARAEGSEERGDGQHFAPPPSRHLAPPPPTPNDNRHQGGGSHMSTMFKFDPHSPSAKLNQVANVDSNAPRTRPPPPPRENDDNNGGGDRRRSSSDDHHQHRREHSDSHAGRWALPSAQETPGQ